MIRSVLVLAAAGAIACAPPGPRGGSRDTNLITQEELLASQASYAYDAIRHLRPMFLRSRGQNTFDPRVPTTPEVFVDGQKYGHIETLKTMPVPQIVAIRFLNASEATTKYGTGYTAGVIEVTTR
ncbi:MAG: hypothetical protein M3365_07275 [Gemmatimonadota bacterium]|nr:hypothetical protein [Gemmatimonadota bacterium]